LACRTRLWWFHAL